MFAVEAQHSAAGKKHSSPQFPKLSPTPETAAAAERAHVQRAIDATAAVLPNQS